jgi:hypothetical protein
MRRLASPGSLRPEIGIDSAPMLERLVVGGILIGALLSACGGSDDTNALKTQVALLQTQMAQPTATATATPSPTATPTPDLTSLCEATASYWAKRGVATKRESEIRILHNNRLDQFTLAERNELAGLYDQAAAITVPLPPPSASDGAQRLLTIVRDLKASDVRHLSAVFENNALAANAEGAVARSLQSDFLTYVNAVCP